MYLIRRLTRSILIVVGVVALVFLLARLSGDPAALYLPLLAPDILRDQFRAMHGLDKPLLEQFVVFIKNALRGDLGDSLWQKRPALEVVLRRLPLTLALATGTTVLCVALALGLGALAAFRPLGWADRFVSIVSLVGIAVPQFWLALIFIMIFSVGLRWLPTSGMGTWKHIVLPVVALGWAPMGALAQIVRCSMLEQMSASYTMTARAKGASEKRVIFKHVLRNALPSIVNMTGRSFVGMANGAIIVETIYGWPGIGRLMVNAIEKRDFAVTQATVLVVAVLVVGVNLAVDIICVAADPQIRFG